MDGRIHSTDGHLRDKGRCISQYVGYLEVVSSLRRKHILVFILALLYLVAHPFSCLVACARLRLVAPAL